MKPPLERLAGAPISWGVSEVAGWGYQMAPERVLDEMRDVGLTATELGPPGHLSAQPGALRRQLEARGLRLAGGFLATVLHQPARRSATLAEIEATARTVAQAGGAVVILAAAWESSGYDRHGRLDSEGWEALAESLAAAEAVAARQGLALAFHPHVGTAVEGPEEVEHLLEAASAGLCLDSGHLFVAGADPLVVAGVAADRVRHVHLKDVDAELAARVRRGELAYSSAVRRGLFRPLGDGDVDIAGLIGRLEAAGYGGWYVLEQDTALSAEPEPGEGPLADVRRSVAFFQQLASAGRIMDRRRHGNRIHTS